MPGRIAARGAGLPDARVSWVSTPLLICALLSFFLREPMASAILFGISGSALSGVWYLPDLLALMCMLLFLAELIKIGRSGVAYLLFAAVVLELIVGFTISKSLPATISAFKLLLPIFVGLALRDEILSSRAVRVIALFSLAIAVGAIFYSTRGRLPWEGTSFDLLGRVRAAKDVFYMYGQRRVSGFAPDPHAAAFCVFAPVALLLLNRRTAWTYVLGLIAIYAINLTTSRTTLGCLLLLLGLSAAYDLKLIGRRVTNGVVLATSIAVVLVPLAIILWALSVSPDQVPYELRSLWARGRFSWLLPFSYMRDLAPFAFVHGYGLGGIGYPLYLADLSAYYVPVDNFHLYNFFVFGAGYIPAYIVLVRGAVRVLGPYKQALFATLTIYCMFLLGYGNSLFLILYGLSIRPLLLGELRSQSQAFASSVQRTSVRYATATVGR